MKNEIGVYVLSVMPDSKINFDATLALEKIAEDGHRMVQFPKLPIMEYGLKFIQTPNECSKEYDRSKYFRKAESLGLKVSGLAIDLSTKNTGTLEERLAESKTVIDLAAAHGVPTVIGHGGESLSEDDAENRAAWDRLVENLKELCTYAKNKNVNVSMEPGGPKWMIHGWKLLKRLCEEVGGDLKVNFDPANIVMGMEDPIEGMRQLKDRVVHCHVKDAAIVGENKAVEKFLSDKDKLNGKFSFAEWLKAVNVFRYYREEPHGTGEVDFKQMFEELKSVNYSGPFIIEREGGETRFEDALNACDLIKGIC